MMTLIKDGRVPRGGWTHTEDGIEFPIDANHKIADLDQLVDEVKRHRKISGGDLGIGWRERFEDELCREHPSYPCLHQAPFIERRLTIADGARFLHTAAKFIHSGGKFVPQEEAERRAAICLRCPLNGEISGCLGCNKIMSTAIDLIGLRRTSHDVHLHSCKNCACLLKLKVHVPLEVMDNDGVGEWPAHCWLRESPLPQDGAPAPVGV